MGGVLRKIGVLVLLPVIGCAGMPAYQENPATLAHTDYDYVWNSTVRVIERYFEVAYENRYDGRISTQPQTGATLYEPWLRDSVDLEERLEATLQTVRRRAFVMLQRGPTGEFLVTVEIYKELEDLRKPIYASFGGGTFIQSLQPVRESLVTSAVTPSAGWISLGRDLKLEARILDELQREIEAHLAY